MLKRQEHFQPCGRQRSRNVELQVAFQSTVHEAGTWDDKLTAETALARPNINRPMGAGSAADQTRFLMLSNQGANYSDEPSGVPARQH